MGTFSYEETFRCYPCHHFVPHVQEWPICPNLAWVISLRSAGMDVRRAASIWKITMNPHDISNVFFDTMTCVSNMRYFNAQGLAHEH